VSTLNVFLRFSPLYFIKSFIDQVVDSSILCNLHKVNASSLLKASYMRECVKPIMFLRSQVRRNSVQFNL